MSCVGLWRRVLGFVLYAFEIYGSGGSWGLSAVLSGTATQGTVISNNCPSWLLRRRSYQESQWLIIMGYFKPIMVYFGVYWPSISSYLALQVDLISETIRDLGTPVGPRGGCFSDSWHRPSGPNEP